MRRPRRFAPQHRVRRGRLREARRGWSRQGTTRSTSCAPSKRFWAPPMNLNDALARPMADIFNMTPSPWSFTAAPSAILYNTSLPLPPRRAGLTVPKPAHNAKYWARVTKGMGLHHRRSPRSGELQPHSLERDDGQQAISRRAGQNRAAPGPRGTPRARPAVNEAKGGAGVEDGFGVMVVVWRNSLCV